MRDPQFFLDDFAAYAKKSGVPLSPDASALLFKVETEAAAANSWIHTGLYLANLIDEIADFKRVLLKHGLDPHQASDRARRVALDTGGDKYQDTSDDLYSSDDGSGTRSLIGGAAVTRARSQGKTSLSLLDLLSAVFDVHDAYSGPLSNAEWTDEGLHVPFNTLSHILGRRYPELWLPFDTVRRDLGLLTPEAMRREPIEGAPSHVRNGLLSFFADNPDYGKNCFLIMPFRESLQLQQVHETLRETLATFDLKLLRADDHVYSENLFTNIEVFMHGCRFGISVIERMQTEQHNANVALEVGYMLGLKKDVCLLKERTVPALPSDLQGRLYTEFDMFAVPQTVRASVGRWLRDRRILGGERDG
ncbi:nucleotide-binding protein [Paucibacter sediminis]|uniref:Nucleotide-binding protein n=1 Tax=Paucibacter sediminis TaxID=3019553 RepID=A0AA95NE21_9BURK|nr:TIR domain-containing protein [Paucibacter sp. S2-9]WIT11117.1 nucleotide-binding protein [Paucibacter sp. S2-9]